jgi:hypothetical protein
VIGSAHDGELGKEDLIKPGVRGQEGFLEKVILNMEE